MDKQDFILLGMHRQYAVYVSRSGWFFVDTEKDFLCFGSSTLAALRQMLDQHDQVDEIISRMDLLHQTLLTGGDDAAAPVE